MMHFHRSSGQFEDKQFVDFPGLLRPNDLLVLNNSRVFPARLFGHRSGRHAQPVSPRNPAAKDFLQGKVEVLLTRQIAPLEWEALVRPGRKIDVGERIFLGQTGLVPGEELVAEVTGRGDFGERTLRFSPVPDFFAAVEKLGHVPLPPYIARPDGEQDRERYQTVYANPDAKGSVAAPTAGLHFTPEVLAAIRTRGIEIAEITLHVGLGTFQPLHVANVEEHQMHRESFTISATAAQQINSALEQRRRVVTVGTTTVRTLEYVAAAGHPSPPADSLSPSTLIPAGSGEA